MNLEKEEYTQKDSMAKVSRQSGHLAEAGGGEMLGSFSQHHNLLEALHRRSGHRIHAGIGSQQENHRGREIL